MSSLNSHIRDRIILPVAAVTGNVDPGIIQRLSNVGIDITYIFKLAIDWINVNPIKYIYASNVSTRVREWFFLTKRDQDLRLVLAERFDVILLSEIDVHLYEIIDNIMFIVPWVLIDITFWMQINPQIHSYFKGIKLHAFTRFGINASI